METLVWAVKNGDLDQVKEKLDDQVSKRIFGARSDLVCAASQSSPR